MAIYLVTDIETDKQRLVRAINSAQAIRHVARRIKAAVAAPETLVELVSSGVRVEDAGEESSPAPAAAVPAYPATSAVVIADDSAQPPAPAIPRDLEAA